MLSEPTMNADTYIDNLLICFSDKEEKKGQVLGFPTIFIYPFRVLLVPLETFDVS